MPIDIAEPDAPRDRTTRASKSQSRDGEATRLWFRTDRVFRQNGWWYISTREHINVGPYETAEEARRDVPRLIELLEEKAPFGEQAQALTIHQFMNRPRLRNRR